MKNFLFICIALLGLQSFTLFFKPVTDYRDSYCGSYNCKRIFKYYNSKKRTLVADTSNYTLNVIKHQSDSVLTISTQDGEFSARLINNKLQGLNPRCSGNFAGNTIYFFYKPSLGPQSYAYTGTK